MADMQEWMQLRLLDFVDDGILERDLRRWTHWWHGKEGQAFWQTCEWLWQTLGQPAIEVVLVCIETALPPRCWVERWRDGDRDAFWQLQQWLSQRYATEAARVVSPLLNHRLADPDRRRTADDLATWAFWAALEELDLKVSGGLLLTEPITVELFQGRVSRRKLGEREPFAWQGAKSFRALFRQMLIARCRDAVRQEWDHDPLPEAGPDDGNGQGGVDAKQIPSDKPSPETVLLKKDALLELGEDLAQVAEQLHYAEDEALAATVEALLLYLKRAVAKYSQGTASLTDDELRQKDVEDLIGDLDLVELEFEETEAWAFVESSLQLTRANRYKRKNRLLGQLPTLPEVPTSLRAVVGALWRTQVKNQVLDCRETAQRLWQKGNRAAAALLALIARYLRWAFATAFFPYRNRSLPWVKRQSLKALFDVNNPALVRPVAPSGAALQQFAHDHTPKSNRWLTELPRLQAVIDQLGQPRPIRLVRLLNALLHTLDAKTDEDTDE